jgi:hypothetical protein
MIRKTWILLPALLLCAALVNQTFAGPISVGNLVVTRVGTGAGALGSSATATFLEEFTTTGAPVQTIAMPTAVVGSNRILTNQGSATSEGFLKLSKNREYLTLAGYDKAPGGTTPSADLPSVTNRVVGVIEVATGNIDTTTALSDAYNGSNIRSAISTNGTDIWVGGNGGSGQGATAGVRYTTLGGTTTVGLHTSVTNQRVVNIFQGQLYSSSSTGSNLGVNTIGTGLPTTSGQTVAILPGMPTTGSHSNYDTFFADPNTLYVADDGNAANGGGIQKWTFDGTTWSLAYTLLNNGATTTSTRGLTGYVNGLGQAVLFATTNQSNANQLITVTDTGALATASVLATAATNTAFRGVAYIAPEPTSAVLMLLVGVAFAGFTRKR